MRKDKNDRRRKQLDNFVNDYKEVYKGKTQDDLIDEVKKIRSNMSDEEFRRQIKAMDKIRSFLNEKQQKKLDKLIKMLEKN
ncbi:MAG: hypothetical protein MJA82_20200 [Clostridia bacterium]|nr:hypothetical protein [Clostridia bacterium]